MKIILKKIIYDFILVFLNYFVAYIPCWPLRKLFYLVFGMKIGRNTRINQRVFIYNPWNIRIASNTIINSFVILDGRGGLEIGSNTSISMRSVVYTASHRTNSELFEYYEKPTVIGDGCWIGVGAVVLPGSILADNTVIGATSVFRGSSEPNGIYVGNPAIFFKHRELKKAISLDFLEFFT